MNIYDISAKAGVSIATVSRVLNGSAKVSPKTRNKVLAVMEEYAYTPNAFARGLGLNTSHTIGILCADSSDLYLAKAVYYLEQMLRDSGYDSILCCCGYEHENKIKYINLLISKKVDSIILVGSNFVEADEADNTYISDAAESVPVMILNADYVAPNVYSCLCDDFHATYSAAEELVKAGRHDILYIYDSTSYSASKKLNGYTACLENHGENTHTLFIERQREAADEVLEVAARITAYYKKLGHLDGVITSDDQLALGAIKFARRQGLNIPADISIIGYNNSLLSVCNEPELSSVDNRLELLCRQLVSNMVNVLNGNEIPRKTIYSGQLVKRDTT